MFNKKLKNRVCVLEKDVEDITICLIDLINTINELKNKKRGKYV